jgi:hypothetical protein
VTPAASITNVTICAQLDGPSAKYARDSHSLFFPSSQRVVRPRIRRPTLCGSHVVWLVGARTKARFNS